MDKNKLWKWLLLAGLLLWSITLVTPFDQKVKLGLDLKGGSSFIVEVDAEDVRQKMFEAGGYESIDSITDSKLNERIKEVQGSAVEMIRNRIDQLGTSEPEIYPEGDSRIMVQLPGADTKTRAEAKDQIMRDGVLSFKLVAQESDQWVQELFAAGIVPSGFTVAGQDGQGVYYVRDFAAVPDMTRDARNALKELGGKTADFMMMADRHPDGSTIYRPLYIERRLQLSGDTIKDSSVQYDPLNQPYISLSFTSEGAKSFGRITEANVGRQLAIILDETLYSAPNLREAIYGGNAQITGGFSVKEARTVVNVLRAGAMPGRVQIVEERTVAPTLGQDSINSGGIAIIAGAIAVVFFMGLYYLVPGLIADLSLVFVLLLLPLGMWFSAGFLGAMSGTLESGSVGLPTLTLYGIAGIVLTIGMAVDANILTFERMREEWKVGKSISGAINAGYNKAFSTILDANVTTLLTAVILFWKGSGPIRGFAVTLSAGILVSMFIVLVITRLFFNSLADAGLLKSIKMMGIPFLQKANFDFVGKRKIAAIVSLSLILVSWINFARKGEANFGVDFVGGTVTTFQFDQAPQIEVVRAALDDAGFSGALLTPIESGDLHLLDMKLKETEGAESRAQDAVMALDGNPTIIKTDSVGSQIGHELISQGIWALVLSFIGIIIYISIRFEFAFAMGAVLALIHDVLITVGLYCAFGRELSLPIIAALLTIVGYSVNDTIVIFDRIREDLKLVKGKSYAEIANLSINQTLSRTVLTSFTTLLTVVMLLFLGGGAVFDFALVLFIGIVVGTYSSVFMATPVALLWHKEDKAVQAAVQ